MAKFVFEKDYDFHPAADWRSIVEYKASETPQTVTRECAKKAKKAGVGDYYKPKKVTTQEGGDAGAKRTAKKAD